MDPFSVVSSAVLASGVKVYTVNSKQNNFLLCQVLLLIYQYPKYHDCC